MALQKNDIRPLNGLRGIAAFWVLLGHVHHNTVGSPLNNILAVDLFIMITGFLMTIIHVDDKNRKIATYYVKRIFRISPLYFALLIAWLAFPVAIEAIYQENWKIMNLPGWSFDRDIRSIMFHFTYIFGFFPKFQESTPLPDWSLSLEMQYYLMFPLIALIFRKFGLKISAVVLISAQIAFTVIFRNQSQYYFPSMLSMKFHIFLCGMVIGCVYLNHSAIKTDSPRLWQAAAVLLAALPIAGHDAVSLGGRAALAVLLVIVVGSERNAIFDGVRNLLSTRLLKYAGDVSYSVYLLHLPVLFVAIRVLRSGLHQPGQPLFWAVLGVTIVGTYILSTLTYRLIELPGMALGRRVSTVLR